MQSNTSDAACVESPVSTSAVTATFENDLVGWQSQVVLETFIDFESATGQLVGDEFANLSFAPNLTLIEGNGLFTGDLAPTQVEPSSGTNVFGPVMGEGLSIEGIVSVTFDPPVEAVGAFFFDVEADFASTGFSTVPGAPLPDVTFSGSQGQSSQSFLGFVSDTPLETVDIHFATGANIDGTVIDDLRFGILTAPSDPFTLDVDRNGSVEPLTDGLNILRVLLGVPEQSLVLGSGASEDTTQATVFDRIGIAAETLALDVDRNNSVGALTDGLNILRVLLGVPEQSLVLGPGVPAGTTQESVFAAIEELR